MSGSDAVEAYGDYLARAERGDAPDFEEWLLGRPEMEDELRALAQSWSWMEGVRIDVPGEDAPPRERYQLRGELGQGGTGIVFRVRDGDLRRDLAMKVCRASRDGPRGKLWYRFLEEAQVTAQLDHPGVAPIHELGVDAEGNTYFTMRLVEGETLGKALEHARRGRDGWSTTRAIGVLVKVCETLAFAHARGVVHRDLKPANVMLGRFGETYVVDWGLAKVLDAESTDATVRQRPDVRVPIRTDRSDALDATPDSRLRTLAGAVVGTPAYMSPEQADGRHDDVGPAADVYAVGAMLYHLLTGAAPYADAVSAEDASAVVDAVRRGSPTALDIAAPRAPDELASICGKAMARDPLQRYADMAELSDDLRAYLEQRVVHAHEAGAWAELQKWVARNRALAVVAATAFVAIVGALAALAWTQQQRVAEVSAENAKAVAVRHVLERVFSAPDPRNLGRDARILDALEAALEDPEVMAVLAGESEVAGLVQDTVAELYSELGLYEEAEAYSRSALTNLQSVLPDDHPEVLGARQSLGVALSRAGDYDAALPLLEEVAAARERELGPLAEETLVARIDLVAATWRSGALSAEEAEAAWGGIAEACSAVLGADAELTAVARTSLARHLVGVGRTKDAHAIFEDVLARNRRILGNRHPETLRTLGHMSDVLLELLDIDACEAAVNEALAARREVLGPRHPEVAESLSTLGWVRRYQGRLDEAHAALSESLSILDASMDREDARRLAVVNNLAWVLSAMNRRLEARPLLHENVEVLERTHGPEDPSTIRALYALAQNYKLEGDLETARGHYETLDARAASLPEDSWLRGLVRFGHGRVLVELGAEDAGWTAVEEAHRILVDTLGADHRNTRQVAQYLETR
jgi:serine/threonine-protein kinase